MKKHILLIIALFLAPCSMIWAQDYFVNSLATPGAATFKADQIVDGVISLPFTASTQTFEIETNQDATVSCDASWCQASYTDGVLTVSVEENPGDNARTAILSVRSKDFHPLPITVKQEARLVFAVISDTHVGNNFGGKYIEKVSKTLQRLTGKNKLDALAVVGDLTDNGYASQYKIFDSLFSHPDLFINPVDKFLFMMGNHDNYSDDSNKTNYKTGLKGFNLNAKGRPTNYPLHQYALIKGYPFITISCLAGANNDDNTTDLYNSSYPRTTVATLEKYLEQAVQDAPGKPIFIFTHVPPRNTCYSTWEDEGAVWAMRTLNPTLNNYPQAVVFCGHSHYPLGDPRSIHQGANPESDKKNYYTVINTASITYSEINPNVVEGESNGIHPEGFKDVTEGMILIEQPNGDIEIRRYDTYRDVEIDPEHRWVLKAPFDGSMFQYADIRDINDNPNNVPLRDGLPAPEFLTENPITLDVYPTDVTVRFQQATDNECVFRYKVSLFKDGTEVRSASVFSQFYLTTDMPRQLSYTFEDLAENTEYTAQVIAYDSWDNESLPQTVSFTTPADDAPVPEPIGWWTFDNPDDLLAGTGIATLQGASHDYGLVEPADNLEDLDITAVEGPTEGNGAVAVPKQYSLLMTTNLEAESLDSYTFLMDIHVPEIKGYIALFQNDLTNTKDGSLFINGNGQVGKGAANLGYNGWLATNEWYRIVFVVRSSKAKLYIDGNLVGQSTSASALNWLISTGALFFADNDDQDGVEEGLVQAADLRFWDKALTAKQVAELGKAIPEDDPSSIVIPEALGVWTFDDPNNLLAGTGTATLQSTTHSQGSVTVCTPEAAGIVPVEGPKGDNVAVTVPVGSSLLMATNLNEQSLTTYSILWDVKGADLSTFVPLLQNDLTNTKDGSLFLNQNRVGLNGSHGMGYNGNIKNNTWYRILFVVQDGYGEVYVNGTLVGRSLSACTEHWTLGSGALFFADNDGEEKELQTAEIRFWNVALNSSQASKLGKAGSTGEPEPEPSFPEAKGTWTFEDSDNLLEGTGVSTLQAATHTKGNVNVTTLDGAGITPVSGPAEGNKAVRVPKWSSLLMTTNLEATTLTSYSILWEIRAENYYPFIALLQNDLTDNKDGSLFISKNAVGLNAGGLKYHGYLTNNNWYRIVFVVEDNYAKVYVNGKKVGQSSQAVAQHWQLSTGALFFADEDGEEDLVEVSEIRFWNEVLTDEQVQTLGSVQQ